MTYTPSHIANYMLERADAEGRTISPMKLLKLVYIAYGWSAALLGRKLFEEPIYAWEHGPVVKSLYHEFKHRGGGAIRERSVDYDLETGDTIIPVVPVGDKNSHIVLDKVWDVYKDFGAWDLRDKTHEDGTPWKEVYRPGDMYRVIPHGSIQDHFKVKIRQYLDHAK